MGRSEPAGRAQPHEPWNTGTPENDQDDVGKHGLAGKARCTTTHTATGRPCARPWASIWPGSLRLGRKGPFERRLAAAGNHGDPSEAWWAFAQKGLTLRKSGSDLLCAQQAVPVVALALFLGVPYVTVSLFGEGMTSGQR